MSALTLQRNVHHFFASYFEFVVVNWDMTHMNIWLNVVPPGCALKHGGLMLVCVCGNQPCTHELAHMRWSAAWRSIHWIFTQSKWDRKPHYRHSPRLDFQFLVYFILFPIKEKVIEWPWACCRSLTEEFESEPWCSIKGGEYLKSTLGIFIKNLLKGLLSAKTTH